MEVALAEAISRAAADDGLTDGRERVPYAALAGRLQELIASLAAASVDPADVVAVELNNDLRSALLVLALFARGQDFVLLPARGLGARAAGEDIDLPTFCRWTLRAVPVGSAAPPPADSWLEAVAGNAFHPTGRRAAGREPCVYFKTSGSLSTPKIVQRSHAALLGDARLAGPPLGLRPGLRIALPLPIYHSFALAVGLLGGVLHGASLDLQERGNVLRFLEREREFDPQVAMMTPTFAKMLVKVRRRPRPYDYLLVGGDVLDDGLAARLRELHGRVVNAYGCTEMGLVSVSAGDAPTPGSVGQPLPDVEWKIDDASETRGDGGQLLVRSARGFRAYVSLDGALVRNAPDGEQGEWYATGDLATPAADGGMLVLGRCALSCNRNGVLVPFADIEARMRRIRGVAEAVIVEGEPNLRGRELIAVCLGEQHAVPSADEVRIACLETMPTYAVPDRIRFVDRMPLLATGKVDRRRLAQDAALEAAGR